MTMIGALSLCLAVQAQDATVLKDPNVVVSKMLQKYAYAQTLSGTIVQEVSDGGGRIKTTTTVKYVRPDYIFVEQDKKGRNGLNRKLVSDDKKFMYTPPDTTPVPVKPREFLYELRHLVNPANSRETVLYVGDMYNAAHVSLASSTILDLVIAFPDHLKDFARINIATIQLAGMVAHQGQTAYRISGTWQPNKPIDGVPSAIGYYELLVSQSFDVLKFTLTETYKVDGRMVKLTITETADLKTGVEVDRSIFRVG
jgi:outer membrane lipoprotein-sorting protein